MPNQVELNLNDPIAQFDPTTYWESRDIKVFAVTLRHVERRGTRGRRFYTASVIYVRARTPEGAARTAKRNYYGRKKICGINVRYATPTELGCVPAGRQAITQ